MNVLSKKVGDFSAKKDWTVEAIKRKKDLILKKTDLKEFIAEVDGGFRFFDDLMVAYYDYLNGGIGSTYIFLSVSEDLDEKDGYSVSYAIASEYQGEVTVDGYIPIGEEERLLSAFKDTLLANTKEFAKLMKSE